MISRKENEFEIPENRVAGISEKKIGERFRGIMNYQVIEKTKSFTMIKIKMLSIIQTKRTF